MSLDNYTETHQTWNKLARLYQEKFMDLEMYNETYDRFCDGMTQANARVLDIGCGPGNMMKYLLTKKPGLEMYGIDVSPNMVQLARENNPTAVCQVMDARQISNLNMTFDGIMCGFCLPYLTHEDGVQMIAQAYHMLHKNGLLYISFVEGDPEASGYQTGSTGDRSFFNFYDAGMLLDTFLKAGFTEPEVYQVPFQRSNGQVEMHSIWISAK